MSDDIIDKLRNAPRQPDCKHGNRPKSCLECDIEELEAENTASMTEIAKLRAENEELRSRNARPENEIERLRSLVHDAANYLPQKEYPSEENSDE